jgi:hypothetical protein
MRKLASVLVASILLAAACSSSGATLPPAGTVGGGAPTTAASLASNGDVTTPPPQPSNGGGDCSFWCGTGSAQVTIGDSTVTISPGGCYAGSDNDVDARFGDFTNQTSDWIIALVYYGGSETPILSGSVGGTAFMLSTSDATGSIGNDGKGSISGTEFLGTATISVTFSCT